MASGQGGAECSAVLFPGGLCQEDTDEGGLGLEDTLSFGKGQLLRVVRKGSATPHLFTEYCGNKSSSMASPRKKRPLKHSSSMSQAKEAELQKAFSLADADGSGRITEEEFYQMYRNQGGHALAQQLVGHFPGSVSQVERRD